MHKQWYCKAEDGRELGPVSRDELVRLARTGRLREEHMVRTHDSALWIRARHVKDLFHSAGTADDLQSAYDAGIVAMRSGTRRCARKRRRSREPWWQRPVGWELIAMVAIILGAAGYTSWTTPESARFPVPRGMQEQVPQRHFFVGTGPWSTLEYALLWFDSALVIGGWAFWRLLTPQERLEE